MKKLTAIVFLVLYFSTTSGATIQLHYCMNKLVSWSISSKTNVKCSKCGMGKCIHKGCCHDESRTIKADNHKASYQYFELARFVFQIEKSISALNKTLIEFTSVTTYPFCNAPPQINNAPVYLLKSVFRI